MTDRNDFLFRFSECLFSELVKGSVSLYRALDSFVYYQKYSYDKEKANLEQLKTLTDKILSIVYNPHIKVETNEIIQRSELSGKLSHDSFSETMRDPRLWKEKRGSMVPEYVHTVETIDSIDTYENRFICLLVSEIYEDVKSLLDDLAPSMESIEEHYQNKTLTFGEFSMIRDMQKRDYPYSSFVFDNMGEADEIESLAGKVNRRVKNLKGTEFYKLVSRHAISRNVIPTNILIHDNLYSYCYRYYVSNYMREEKEDRKRQVLYFNYVLVCLLLGLRKKGILTEGNSSFLLDNGVLSVSLDHLVYGPFQMEVCSDSKDLSVMIRVVLSLDNGETRESGYSLLVRDIYTQNNKEQIKRIKAEKENEGYRFILVTGNNIVKDYDSVLTLSFHRQDGEKKISDLLSAMTVLMDGDRKLFSGYCPVCGHRHVRFDGMDYVCKDCNSRYVISDVGGRSLLWIESLRRE